MVQRKLSDVVRDAVRVRQYSYRTEQAHVCRSKRFIQRHAMRHPRNMDAAAIGACLTHPAVRRNVAAATQNQALHAIGFPHRHVLEVDLPWIDELVRGKERARMPVVLTPAGVACLLARVRERESPIACMLYTHVRNRGGRAVRNPLDLREPRLAYAA